MATKVCGVTCNSSKAEQIKLNIIRGLRVVSCVLINLTLFLRHHGPGNKPTNKSKAGCWAALKKSSKQGAFSLPTKACMPIKSKVEQACVIDRRLAA
jgi:hypothetical protein